IVDDLLDYTANQSTTGKPSGLDLHEHKVTLPLIYALPRFTKAERKTLEALLGNQEPSEQEIAKVIAAVSTHGGLEAAYSRAQRLIAQAEEDLALLPESGARETLRGSLSYVLERQR